MASTRVITAKNRNRLLMKIKEVSGADPWNQVELGQAAQSLGVTLDQARVLALHMQQQGLIRYQGYIESSAGRGPGAVITITSVGLEEAWRLSLPWWWRWTKKDVFVAAIVCTTISTILSATIAAVVTYFLTRWLVP